MPSNIGAIVGTSMTNQKVWEMFHQHNELIELFKIVLDRMPSDTHKIVIKAEKTPIEEHTRRFNAPTIDEAAIVINGD